MRKVLLPLLISISLCSCSSAKSGPQVSDLITVGALSGGLIGAGAGAVIGSVIHDGSIARSALLGGGIGIAAGTIFAGGHNNIAMNETINSQQGQIEKNNQQLKSQAKVISELRQDIDDQGRSIQLDSSRKSQIYDGATIGSYYR